MTLPTWRIGQTWWVGSSCLLCVGIDLHGSHESEEIATYDASTSTSRCPRCDCQLVWSSAPAVHDLPWCADCQDLDARRWDVDRARARWETAVHEARFEPWDGHERSRERALLEALHRADEAYHEISTAVFAREEALEDECPATLPTGYPSVARDGGASETGGKTQEVRP